MACFLRYCVFGLLSLSVLTAHASRTIVVEPGQLVRTYGSAPFQFSDSRNWNATVSTQSGASVKVPVKATGGYSPAKIAGALKNLLKMHPGKVAGTALAAYLIEQMPGTSFIGGVPHIATGEPPPSTFACTTGVPCWTASHHGDGQNVCTRPSPKQAFECSAAMRSYSTTVQKTGMLNGDSLTLYYYSQTCPDVMNGCSHFNVYSVNTYNSHLCPSGTTFKSATKTCDNQPVPLPFTDADYDAFTAPVQSLPPNIWQNDLGPLIGDNIPATFDGPDQTDFTGPPSVDLPSTTTTSVDAGTGQTTVIESLPSLQFEYSSNPNTITSTPTTVTNTYQNGNLTNTTTTTTNTTTTTTPTPVAEIPTDCEFMPTVCAFIEWVKTPFNEEDPDLSELIADEDFEKEINFSSNATCPGPSMISTSHGDFEFSWEPGCQWAGMIKPLIIIAALVAAIFINLGTARGPE